MNRRSSSFDGYVIKNILTNNQFGISEVNNLKSLNSIFFVKEEYDKIKSLFRFGNIEALKTLPQNQSGIGEYLAIMIFIDQNEKKYIVTVYDSIALEQDPQVIDIYSL